MYISTCNRVEFCFVCEADADEDFLIEFFHAFNPEWSETQLQKALKISEIYKGEDAIRHIFNVASSLDSMVIGEREIITQVRSSYENCNNWGLTGDLIRLVMKKTVETAKEVYTNTDIATKPVSVVSLAYRKLREYSVNENARIVFIGAGQTNTNMARFLKKNGFNNFIVFNRSMGNGLALANELKCEMKELSEITKYKNGFDVIIACTAAEEAIITDEVYSSLLNGETTSKVVVDLAIPNDLDKSLLKKYNIKFVDIENLKSEAEINMRERAKEVDRCQTIVNDFLKDFKELYRIRQVELAMKEVPTKMKEIKEMAVNSVFAKDIEGLDENSKEVLEKVINYLEKKYISVPMKMAKDILLDKPVVKTPEPLLEIMPN
jgi:glutamyl-tRNA reductase